jgi:hypothetical protein
MYFGPTYLLMVAEGKEIPTPSEARGMAQRVITTGAALRRLLSVAEDYEDDEFVADACAEARAAVDLLTNHTEQVGASKGPCDCCGADNVERSFSVTYGIETWSCTEGCRIDMATPDDVTAPEPEPTAE